MGPGRILGGSAVLAGQARARGQGGMNDEVDDAIDETLRVSPSERSRKAEVEDEIPDRVGL